jgi:hypothetical protein
MTASTAETIECPLCGLPHEPTAAVCDDCGQDLRSKPKFDELRAELQDRRQGMVLAAIAIALMLAANIAVFRGAAYVVLVAPFGWLGWSWLRWRTIRAKLQRHGELSPRDAS